MSERQRRSRQRRRLGHGRSARAVAGGGLLVVGSLVSGAVAQAGPTKHVEVFSDSGAAAGANAATMNYADGETLADAITYLNANGGGTITFASSLSGHTIDLAADLPTITATTTVTGLGAHKLAVSGDGTANTFYADGSAGLTISGLTVKDSIGDDVWVLNGSLTITNSVIETSRHVGVIDGDRNDDAPNVRLSGDTIKDNAAGGVTVTNAAVVTLTHCLVDADYGGVAVDGPTTITDSSIVNNRGGGGFYDSDKNGDSLVTIVNSTVSNNLYENDYSGEAAFGGGIGLGPGISLTLIGDTVTANESRNTSTTNNSDAIGGGIGMPPTSGDATLKLEDTVVAGNKVVVAQGYAKYPDVVIAPGIRSVVKDSLIGAGKTAADTLAKLTLSSSDQVGTTKHQLNPKLGKLKAAGSKTATAGGALDVQKPEKGSPLIGKGAAKPFSTKAVPFKTDELGIARPAKGVTIGAYQVPSKKKHKKRRK